MASAPGAGPASVSTRVSIIAVTAVLYVLGKGLTAYIPTPWLVGQLLIGIFLPAFFALVSETLPAAIGAGIGTFAGDVLFLTPAGATNAPLSLIAGVPANFVAFLLFGWFVKKYRTWSGFVAATVSFVTLGNLIAATSVVLFGAYVFGPAAGLSHFSVASAILGFTVFWNMTSIPAILIGVPILVRSVRPLFGRSQIIRYEPTWVGAPSSRETMVSLAFGALFVALGVVFLVGFYSTTGIWAGLDLYVPLASAVVLVFAPLASMIAGTRLQAKEPNA